MKAYYLQLDGQRQGPYTFDDLSDKKITAQTPIWYEGLENWTIAGSIPELKSLLIAKTIPPPLQNYQTSVESDKKSSEKLYEPLMNQYFPSEKKRSFKVPVIIGSLVIVIAIIGWLIIKNSQNSKTIGVLQDQVEIQRQETAKKELEERTIAEQKESEEKIYEEKNFEYRTNWNKYIRISNSKPEINYTLGGISAFYVYVKNETDYILDQVHVEVKYIRKNGEVWQIKDLSFLNVAANATENQIAPNSINGVEIKVEIKKIMCKKMSFCYPINSGNADDPYFCK